MVEKFFMMTIEADGKTLLKVPIRNNVQTSSTDTNIQEHAAGKGLPWIYGCGRGGRHKAQASYDDMRGGGE